MKITIEIGDPEPLLEALRDAQTSLGHEMFYPAGDSLVGITALAKTIEAAVEHEALYDDSRSHTRIDGMVKPEHVYCEYHDQYEESDA